MGIKFIQFLVAKCEDRIACLRLVSNSFCIDGRCSCLRNERVHERRACRKPDANSSYDDLEIVDASALSVEREKGELFPKKTSFSNSISSSMTVLLVEMHFLAFFSKKCILRRECSELIGGSHCDRGRCKCPTGQHIYNRTSCQAANGQAVDDVEIVVSSDSTIATTDASCVTSSGEDVTDHTAILDDPVIGKNVNNWNSRA